MITSGHTFTHLTPTLPSSAYMNPLSIDLPGYHKILDEEMEEACAVEMGVDIGLGWWVWARFGIILVYMSMALSKS